MTKRSKIIHDINSHSALSQDVALVFHWTNNKKKKAPLVNWTRLTLQSRAGEAEGLRRDWEKRLFRLIKKERHPCWYLLRTPTCESRSKGWNYSYFLRDKKIQRAWKILKLTERRKDQGLFFILQSICIRTGSCLTWIWHASLADWTTRVAQARDAGLVVVSSHLVYASERQKSVTFTRQRPATQPSREAHLSWPKEPGSAALAVDSRCVVPTPDADSAPSSLAVNVQAEWQIRHRLVEEALFRLPMAVALC